MSKELSTKNVSEHISHSYPSREINCYNRPNKHDIMKNETQSANKALVLKHVYGNKLKV